MLRRLELRCRILILGLVSLLFTGCLGHALRKSYADYSEVYADAINNQLLLNLARLSRNEPPYFIQLGQINSQFTFSGSAGFGPSQVRTKNPGGNPAAVVQETVTMGGSIGAAVSETPTFQYIPLNGDIFAQAINAPLSDKLFYTLFDQGFHADLLLRTMVTAIVANKAGGPPEIYENQPLSSTYSRFLSICNEIRRKQISHELIVGTFATEPHGRLEFADAKLSEAVSAASAGFLVTNNGAGTPYAAIRQSKQFGLVVPHGIEPTTNAYATFTTQSEQTAQPSVTHSSYSFRMRTFVSALYAASKEESYYENRRREGGGITNDAAGLIMMVPNTAPSGPRVFPVRPLLSLRKMSGPHLSDLAMVEYRGLKFRVADDSSISATPERPATDNCRVFTLLSYLYTQIAIDPQKLPVQQFIQVR